MLPSDVASWGRYEWSIGVNHLKRVRGWLSWWTYEQGIRKFCFPCDKTVLWFHRVHCGYHYYFTQLSDADRAALQRVCDDYWAKRKPMPPM